MIGYRFGPAFQDEAAILSGLGGIRVGDTAAYRGSNGAVIAVPTGEADRGARRGFLAAAEASVFVGANSPFTLGASSDDDRRRRAGSRSRSCLILHGRPTPERYG
jgi:hypothetical protein